MSSSSSEKELLDCAERYLQCSLARMQAADMAKENARITYETTCEEYNLAIKEVDEAKKFLNKVVSSEGNDVTTTPPSTSNKKKDNAEEEKKEEDDDDDGLINTYTGYTDEVLCATFIGGGGGSCNNTKFLSCSADVTTNTIELWNSSTGQCIRSFNGHKKFVSCVAVVVSPTKDDGDEQQPPEQFVSGSYDCTLKLWNINNGKCLRTYKGHNKRISCVSIISIQELQQQQQQQIYIVSGSWDKTIKLWNIEKTSCIHTFDGHDDGIRCLMSIPNSNTFLSGSRDKTIKLWYCKKYNMPSATSVSASTSATTGGGGDDNEEKTTIKETEVTNNNTSRCIQTYVGHTDYVTSLCIVNNRNKDNETFISSSRDKTIKLWSLLSNKQCLYTFEGHTSYVYSICVTTITNKTISGGLVDEQIIISGDTSDIKLWNIKNGNCIHTYTNAHNDNINSISTTSTMTMSTTKNNTNNNNNKDNNKNNNNNNNDYKFLSASNDKTIKLWKLLV